MVGEWIYQAEKAMPQPNMLRQNQEDSINLKHYSICYLAGSVFCSSALDSSLGG